MFKTKYYLKGKQGIILGVVKVNEEENVLNWNKLVDLLNSLTEEKEQLQKENEQLRQFINKGRRLSVKEFMNSINENESLKKKIKDLEKDNKQLRKQLEM